MPLRDHFRAPLDDLMPWDGLHGGWPMKIVESLGPRLPGRYIAAPLVHLGSSIEVDAAAFDRGRPGPLGGGGGEADAGGGVAVAAWAPPRPTLAAAVAAADAEADAYEVRVYDARRGRRLVAAVELVSPSNKDRPERRRAFAAECAALLREGVCVAVVDVVTTRGADLHGELLGQFGLADPASGAAAASATIAASCRLSGGGRELEAWAYRLEVGRGLPTLPLWLSEELAVPLELEASYEDTCRALRIP